MSDLDGQEREALTAHIAERLREARAGKNWSQDQLANECGWTQAAVSLYEAGHRRTGIYELCVLAEKLERPLAFFLDQLPRVAALAAREEPHVKGAILQIGTVVEGRPEGWVFDGAHIGHLILPDGSQVCGGWTVSELELIGAAREDTERPDDYWNLCCECGYITIADSWLALNFNEAHEDETTPYEPRLIPAESDPSVYRCPA
jgi:transcriptional regulator with XRE-family HTH domain